MLVKLTNIKIEENHSVVIKLLHNDGQTDIAKLKGAFLQQSENDTTAEKTRLESPVGQGLLRKRTWRECEWRTAKEARNTTTRIDPTLINMS
jgi:hypothetical protein